MSAPPLTGLFVADPVARRHARAWGERYWGSLEAGDRFVQWLQSLDAEQQAYIAEWGYRHGDTITACEEACPGLRDL